MNRSYQIKREILAEKEEQERAMRAYRKPSLWQRIRDWFFPFNIK